MAHNTIVLKIFKDKSNLDDFSVYICSMTEKIIDIKNKILKDIFQRLLVGFISDAEPLDLMQADGSCERLPTQFTPILNLKFSLLHETKIKNKCCKSDKTGRQI